MITFHVGMNRAMSSTFQALLRREGVRHLLLRGDEQPLFHALVFSPFFRPAAWRAAVLDRLGGAEGVVSQEGLWCVEDEFRTLRRLKESFDDARLLFVVRRPVDWMASRYAYQVGNRGSESRPWGAHFMDMAGPLERYGRLGDYVETAQQLFGRDRVHVEPFERLCRETTFRLNWLLRWAGHRGPSVLTEDRVPWVNVGPRTAAVLAFQRWRNRHRRREVVGRPNMRLSAVLEGLLGWFLPDWEIPERDQRHINDAMGVSLRRLQKNLREDLRRWGYPL